MKRSEAKAIDIKLAVEQLGNTFYILERKDYSDLQQKDIDMISDEIKKD